MTTSRSSKAPLAVPSRGRAGFARAAVLTRLLALGQIENHQSFVSEFANRVSGALACVARILDAAVGHLVGPERGRLVDDDAAELELLRGVQRSLELAREDPGLEPVARAVGELDRLVHRADRVDSADRAEDLL